MINHHFNNAGAGIAFNGGPVQFYLISDNWIGTINPLSNNTAHFQFGFNLIYGRKKTKKDPDYGVQNKDEKTNTKSTIMAEPIDDPDQQKDLDKEKKK